MSKNNRYLIAILIIAAIIRLATVWCGTNVDEGVYWAEGKQLADGYVIYRDTQFNKTPLAPIIAALFFLVGDAPIIPMRLAMVLFSLIGLLALWLLSKELLGEKAAWAALLILTLEPFTCIWAKYLHTSTWAPWFETIVYWLLITGLIRNNTKRILLSGVVLGLYALSKQTAIFVIPPAIAAWLIFCQEKSLDRFIKDGLTWIVGIMLIMAPFLITMLILGALPAMWFDIWTAHHLMAGAFTHHTMIFRWHEWKSIVNLAPVLWILPLGSLMLLKGKQYKTIGFVWILFITVLLGNIIIPTHLWRHYFLVCAAPTALLAGAFAAWLLDQITQRFEKKTLVNWIGIGVFILASMAGWPKNDWFYPGISLTDESNLAKHAKRFCDEPYLLNLTNPALYVWTDKEIPPAFQGERMTRMPFFMTIAGRGYMTPDDMQRTVEYWKTLPIGCVVAYDKYIRQIMDDPLMTPMREWLDENFKPPQRVSFGESYYGWFFIFERDVEKQ